MEEEESAEKVVFSCESRNNGKKRGSARKERGSDTDPYFYYYAVSVVSV